MALVSTFGNWLHRKKYQFEVTFCVYIFTPYEKFIFCTSVRAPERGTLAPPFSPQHTTGGDIARFLQIPELTIHSTDTLLFLLVGLTFIATALYLPQHIAFIVGRMWFYILGENVDVVELTKEAVDNALSYTTSATSVVVEHTATVVKEL